MKNRSLYHLLHKEFYESRKNHKLLIVLVTFILFGLLSPLTATYMPDLLKMVGAQQGVTIEVTPPLPQDSLIQFHSNITQVCLFVMIFLVMGMISLEKERGTAAFLMVKPVSRNNFILSKFIAMVSLVLTGLIAAIAVCGAYTFILFESVPIADLLRMSLYLFSYLLVILSISLLLSTIFSCQIIAGIGTFIIWLVLEGLSAVPKLGTFLPGGISREAQAAAVGMSTKFTPLIGAGVIILFCVIFSMQSLRRWEA